MTARMEPGATAAASRGRPWPGQDRSAGIPSRGDEAGHAGLLAHDLHRAGPAGSPTLLLIHPLGADRGFWDDCLAIWRPAISCLAVDLRSAGRSPRADGPATVARHVADLETLRTALGIATVAPVGCAVGAMVAAAYAAACPRSIHSLVLANAAWRTSEAAAGMLRQRAALVRARGMAALLPEAVDRAFLDQPDDERRARYATRFAAQDAEAYAQSALGAAAADVSAELAALRCPTLVAAGARDVLLPPAEQAREVHARVAGARFVLFEEAAHFIPYQQPERFARLVLDFVAGRRP